VQGFIGTSSVREAPRLPKPAQHYKMKLGMALDEFAGFADSTLFAAVRVVTLFTLRIDRTAWRPR